MRTELDVLVLGGGIAGLWTLDTLHRRGYRVALLEQARLGQGQSIQAQGIVHGGGKYALRSVEDLPAMRAIREMPARWRAHLSGDRQPDLRDATLLSDSCLLWLASGDWRDRLSAWGMRPLLRHSGVLAVRPKPLPKADWPEVLQGAQAVYSMAEPVVAMGSVLDALAARNRSRLGRAEAWEFEREGEGHLLRGEGFTIRARLLVLSAGVGNQALMDRLKIRSVPMQRRALRMFLLRGPALPSLFGHCVAGGRTRLTVTSAPFEGETVWQLGGEIAEQHRNAPASTDFRSALLAELRRCVPGLSLSGLRMSTYDASRAESARSDGKRPSGVHLERASGRVLVAWPTKMALAPVLADEIATAIQETLGAASQDPGPLQWGLDAGVPTARYPWEEREWEPLD